MRDPGCAVAKMAIGFLVQTEGFFLSAEAAHCCFLPIHGHVPTCSEVLEFLEVDGWLRALQSRCPF